MPTKRRRSSASEHIPLPASKKSRTKHPLDYLSDLSDELLIRILHKLPIHALLQCQRLSHRFYTLAGDSQIWKNLYYNRFVLPRALRIPGIKAAQSDEALHFSSRRSKWLGDNGLVNRVDGKKTNWKGQYKLRHNWSIGACEVQEIHVADQPSVPSMLVRLADGVVVTADKEGGLRAWDLKGKDLIAKCDLGGDIVPTCLAVDDQESDEGGLRVAVGFMDGGWGTWSLDAHRKTFVLEYTHPSSSNGTLSAVAYANPYILTITNAQRLSLYTFAPKLPIQEIEPGTILLHPIESESEAPAEPQHPTSTSDNLQPRLLASLKSHTCWPPLSLSIRTTPTTLIASIAYAVPTYLSGYTIGLQELHLSLSTALVTFSRLASALPQGFSSLLSPSPSPTPGTASPIPTHQTPPATGTGTSTTRPTTLSYSHPYILATHPDNTLTLYLCTSDPTTLSISPGTKLWGHTSSVSSAEITPRGKAVSVSTRGDELRVWELEGAGSSFSSSSSSAAASFSSSPSSSSSSSARKRLASSGARFAERSVRVVAEAKEEGEKGRRESGSGSGSGDGEGFGGDPRGFGEVIGARKQWVGFDDEVVIVLKESERGTQALMVYDFT